MNNYKIVLIHLRNPREQNANWSVKPAYFENLGLAYVASSLRKAGFKVQLIDAALKEMNEADTFAEVRIARPDFVGLSLSYRGYPEGLNLSRRIKEWDPSVHICLGGHHATFSAERILNTCPEIDSIVLGEGEVTTVELATALKNKIALNKIPGIFFRENGSVIKNPQRNKIERLDILPFPVRDNLEYSLKNSDSHAYTASVISSRGCPASCSFCSVVPFFQLGQGSIWRARSAENFVDELEELKSKYGIVSVLIADDNIIGPRTKGKERARKIAEEMIRRNLQILFSCCMRVDSLDFDDAKDRDLLELLIRAGLFSVFIGLELGCEEDFDLYNKKVDVRGIRRTIQILQKSGIGIDIGYLMYNPYSTIDSLIRNARFLKSIHQGLQFFYYYQKVELQPGILLIEKLKTDELLRECINLGDVFYYTFKDPRVKKIAEVTDAMYDRMMSFDVSMKMYQLNTFHILSQLKATVRHLKDISLKKAFKYYGFRYRSLMEVLNKTHYETFMRLIQLAKLDAPDLDFKRVSRQHELAIKKLDDSFKANYNSLCHFLGRLSKIYLQGYEERRKT